MKLKAADQVSIEAAQDDRGYLSAQKVQLEKSPGQPAPSSDSAETKAPPRSARPRSPPTSSGAAEKRAAAAAFSEQLPDYICQQYMARFESTSRPPDWKALDVVSAEVVYKGGHETYRNLAINGKPVHKQMKELDGAWSTGEFGSELLDLLSPSTAAEFRFRSESSASGTPARVYNFEVQQARSHWRVQVASQAMNPGYKGSVWIDPKTGRVMRMEMQAQSLPDEFPMDVVESVVDYGNVRIGQGQYYLPVHAENLACRRGGPDCSKSAIDFRNYHKYDASSSVTFDNGTE